MYLSGLGSQRSHSVSQAGALGGVGGVIDHWSADCASPRGRRFWSFWSVRDLLPGFEI